MEEPTANDSTVNSPPAKSEVKISRYGRTHKPKQHYDDYCDPSDLFAKTPQRMKVTETSSPKATASAKKKMVSKKKDPPDDIPGFVHVTGDSCEDDHTLDQTDEEFYANLTRKITTIEPLTETRFDSIMKSMTSQSTPVKPVENSPKERKFFKTTTESKLQSSTISYINKVAPKPTKLVVSDDIPIREEIIEEREQLIDVSKVMKIVTPKTESSKVLPEQKIVSKSHIKMYGNKRKSTCKSDVLESFGLPDKPFIESTKESKTKENTKVSMIDIQNTSKDKNLIPAPLPDKSNLTSTKKDTNTFFGVEISPEKTKYPVDLAELDLTDITPDINSNVNDATGPIIIDLSSTVTRKKPVVNIVQNDTIQSISGVVPLIPTSEQRQTIKECKIKSIKPLVSCSNFNNKSKEKFVTIVMDKDKMVKTTGNVHSLSSLPVNAASNTAISARSEEVFTDLTDKDTEKTATESPHKMKTSQNLNPPLVNKSAVMLTNRITTAATNISNTSNTKRCNINIISDISIKPGNKSAQIKLNPTAIKTSTIQEKALITTKPNLTISSSDVLKSQIITHSKPIKVVSQAQGSVVASQLKQPQSSSQIKQVSPVKINLQQTFIKKMKDTEIIILDNSNVKKSGRKQNFAMLNVSEHSYSMTSPRRPRKVEILEDMLLNDDDSSSGSYSDLDEDELLKDSSDDEVSFRKSVKETQLRKPVKTSLIPSASVKVSKVAREKTINIVSPTISLLKRGRPKLIATDTKLDLKNNEITVKHLNESITKTLHNLPSSSTEMKDISEGQIATVRTIDSPKKLSLDRNVSLSKSLIDIPSVKTVDVSDISLILTKEPSDQTDVAVVLIEPEKDYSTKSTDLNIEIIKLETIEKQKVTDNKESVVPITDAKLILSSHDTTIMPVETNLEEIAKQNTVVVPEKIKTLRVTPRKAKLEVLPWDDMEIFEYDTVQDEILKEIPKVSSISLDKSGDIKKIIRVPPRKRSDNLQFDIDKEMENIMKKTAPKEYSSDDQVIKQEVVEIRTETKDEVSTSSVQAGKKVTRISPRKRHSDILLYNTRKNVTSASSPSLDVKTESTVISPEIEIKNILLVDKSASKLKKDINKVPEAAMKNIKSVNMKIGITSKRFPGRPSKASRKLLREQNKLLKVQNTEKSKIITPPRKTIFAEQLQSESRTIVKEKRDIVQEDLDAINLEGITSNQNTSLINNAVATTNKKKKTAIKEPAEKMIRSRRSIRKPDRLLDGEVEYKRVKVTLKDIAKDVRYKKHIAKSIVYSSDDKEEISDEIILLSDKKIETDDPTVKDIDIIDEKVSKSPILDLEKKISQVECDLSKTISNDNHDKDAKNRKSLSQSVKHAILDDEKTEPQFDNKEIHDNVNSLVTKSSKVADEKTVRKRKSIEKDIKAIDDDISKSIALNDVDDNSIVQVCSPNVTDIVDKSKLETDKVNLVVQKSLSKVAETNIDDKIPDIDYNNKKDVNKSDVLKTTSEEMIEKEINALKVDIVKSMNVDKDEINNEDIVKHDVSKSILKEMHKEDINDLNVTTKIKLSEEIKEKSTTDMVKKDIDKEEVGILHTSPKIVVDDTMKQSIHKNVIIEEVQKEKLKSDKLISDERKDEESASTSQLVDDINKKTRTRGIVKSYKTIREILKSSSEMRKRRIANEKKVLSEKTTAVNKDVEKEVKVDTLVTSSKAVDDDTMKQSKDNNAIEGKVQKEILESDKLISDELKGEESASTSQLLDVTKTRTRGIVKSYKKVKSNRDILKPLSEIIKTVVDEVLAEKDVEKEVKVDISANFSKTVVDDTMKQSIDNNAINKQEQTKILESDKSTDEPKDEEFEPASQLVDEINKKTVTHSLDKPKVVVYKKVEACVSSEIIKNDEKKVLSETITEEVKKDIEKEEVGILDPSPKAVLDDTMKQSVDKNTIKEQLQKEILESDKSMSDELKDVESASTSQLIDEMNECFYTGIDSIVQSKVDQTYKHVEANRDILKSSSEIIKKRVADEKKVLSEKITTDAIKKDLEKEVKLDISVTSSKAIVDYTMKRSVDNNAIIEEVQKRILESDKLISDELKDEDSASTSELVDEIIKTTRTRSIVKSYKKVKANRNITKSSSKVIIKTVADEKSVLSEKTTTDEFKKDVEKEVKVDISVPSSKAVADDTVKRSVDNNAIIEEEQNEIVESDKLICDELKNDKSASTSQLVDDSNKKAVKSKVVQTNKNVKVNQDISKSSSIVINKIVAVDKNVLSVSKNGTIREDTDSLIIKENNSQKSTALDQPDQEIIGCSGQNKAVLLSVTKTRRSKSKSKDLDRDSETGEITESTVQPIAARLGERKRKRSSYLSSEDTTLTTKKRKSRSAVIVIQSDEEDDDEGIDVKERVEEEIPNDINLEIKVEKITPEKKQSDSIATNRIRRNVRNVTAITRRLSNRIGIQNKKYAITLPMPISMEDSTATDAVKSEVTDPDIDNDIHEPMHFDVTIVKNEVEYKEGDFVWAKVGCQPYWPAMVIKEPMRNESQKNIIVGKSRNIFYYHVRFYADNGRRSWIRSASMIPYTSKDDLTNIVNMSKGKHGLKFKVQKNQKDLWDIAIIELESQRGKTLLEKEAFFTRACQTFNKYTINKKKTQKKNLLSDENVKISLRSTISKTERDDRKASMRSRNTEKQTPKLEQTETSKRRRRTILSTTEENPPKHAQSFIDEDLAMMDKETNASDETDSSSVVTDSNSIMDSEIMPNTMAGQIALRARNNLFEGVVRDRLCEICLKGSHVLRCQGKCGYYHVECAKQQLIETIESTPAVSSDDEPFLKIPPADVETSSVSSGSTSTSSNSVGLKSKKATVVFSCRECVRRSCFVCGRVLSPSGKTSERKLCGLKRCGKYYHVECMRLWPQAHFTLSLGLSRSMLMTQAEGDVFICPRHVCHICVSDDPKASSARTLTDVVTKCLQCPASYHAQSACIPAGTEILSSHQIVCPRHPSIPLSFKQTVSKPCKLMSLINTNWCFICSEGGDLVCCETCPTSVHQKCLSINWLDDGTFVCEECESGRLVLYDEVVWAKLGSYRWWPAIVLHPDDVPQNVRNLRHRNGEFVVRFYGSYDHYWMSRRRVFLFEQGDKGNSTIIKSKNVMEASFDRAVEEATAAYALKKKYKAQTPPNRSIKKKPPSYIKLRCNKPVGNVKQYDGNLSITAPCECKPSSKSPCGPDNNCLNRVLWTECNPTNCPAGAHCQNQLFERRQYPALAPRYIAGARGWGLETVGPLKGGQFVIEYVGELIDPQEYKRRVKQMHQVQEVNYYFLTIDRERLIDAGPKGNVSRFMNHSCDPNCETQKWKVNGDTRVGLFAINDIAANEELTFNYNLSIIGEEPQLCMCGSANCTGFIGGKPKNGDSNKNKK